MTTIRVQLSWKEAEVVLRALENREGRYRVPPTEVPEDLKALRDMLNRGRGRVDEDVDQRIMGDWLSTMGSYNSDFSKRPDSIEQETEMKLRMVYWRGTQKPST